VDSVRRYEPSSGGKTNPLVSCVDAALDSYGESVKYVVYWNLQKNYKVEKSAIPENPDKFVAIIESIFGVGADFVKDKIILSIQQLSGSTERSLEMIRVLRKSMSSPQKKR
jgi:hypothetical protein